MISNGMAFFVAVCALFGGYTLRIAQEIIKKGEDWTW